MERFDLKNHNKKMFVLAKSAAEGTYPSKKVAKIGSMVGSAIGLMLVLIGAMSLLLANSWGFGSLFAGIIVVISNVLNLRRIK